jgi:hypothetical protein
MNLHNIKQIVEEEGLVGVINPVHRHVDVKYDDLDIESIAFIEPTADGGARHDGIAKSGTIAKNEEELRDWCKKQLG